MISPTRGRAAAAVAVATLTIVLLSGCSVDPVPGRFTYIVKYEVSADAAVSIDIDFTDETGTSISAVGSPIAIDPTTPWSYEFPAAFNYDDPLFYPTLDASAAAALNPGETVKVKIIWKDYRVDFQEQALETGYLYHDGTTVVDAISLIGPELPQH